MPGGGAGEVTARAQVRRWWAQGWLGVLDQLGPADSRALARGQALARRGLVEPVEVAAGRCLARIVEDRTAPVTVTVHWTPAPAAAWDAATAVLAGQLRFTAGLLDGELDPQLGPALAELGIELAPAREDLVVEPSCAEEGWCRHVIATIVAAGLRFDQDPGALLRLRGQELEVLIGRVRAVHAPREPVAVPDRDGFTRARGDLDAIALHPAPVRDPAGLLRHLGPPPGVEDPEPLEAVVARAAAMAWRLAAGDGPGAADVELLLAELRGQRTATVAALARAVGRPEHEVEADLDALYEDGRVLRTGTGPGARYRAAPG